MTSKIMIAKGLLRMLYVCILVILINSCDTTKLLPLVSTADLTNISHTTVTCGGFISSDGGLDVVARGVCWSTNPNPTIAHNKTIDAAGTGAFTSLIKNLIPDTTYFLRAYATNEDGTAYGLQITFRTLPTTLPVVSTKDITNISHTSASCEGEVISDGGLSIIARGVCWSTKQNPTIEDKKTIDGTETGLFESSMIDLEPNKRYYVRAYATNNNGTSYGNQLTFIAQSTVTDVDGNVYFTVKIGSQTWMAENLKVSRFNDGTSIPFVPNYDWIYLTSPGMCYVNGDSYTKNTHGFFYNYYAVSTGKLAPEGWRVPTELDIQTLINYLGGASVAGGKLKEAGFVNWATPNTGATNDSYFSAIGSGYRSVVNGTYVNYGVYGCWWTSSESNASAGRLLLNNTSSIAENLPEKKRYVFNFI